MQEKIKKLKEIIEWVYKMQPVSVDLLEIKEEFNNLYEIIDEQTEKMEEEEYFEFRCLKYEYELNYIYRFEYHNEIMRQIILESLDELLENNLSHKRIKKLTEKIFLTGKVAVEEQAEILKKSVVKSFRIPWVWEEYAEQYAERQNYEEALKYYWQALDEYLFIVEKADVDISKIVFYEGNSLLYISDLIYRMYKKVVFKGELWKDFIEGLKNRRTNLESYSYYYLYLAISQFEWAQRINISEEMLDECLDTLGNIPQENWSEECYIIACTSLYLLKRYQSVLDMFEIAKRELSELSSIQKCSRVAFFTALEMILIHLKQKNQKKFGQMLNEAAEVFCNVPIDMMDGAKKYIPIFYFYIKHKNDVNIECIKKMFELIEISCELMQNLEFHNDEVELGYYTSLSSLKFVLNDEQKEVKYRLSLFDARHMNDPKEGKVLNEYLGRRTRKNSISQNEIVNRWSYDSTIIFLKSFTTKIDSLPMWVQYGDGGKGCFVCLDKDMFNKGIKLVESRKDANINNLREEESYLLYNVAYYDGEKFCTSSGKEVTPIMKKIRDIYIQIFQIIKGCTEEIKIEVEEVIDRILKRVQYLVKKNDYINEEEVRIFFLRNGDENDIEITNVQGDNIPRMYLHLKVSTEIKEIILGPKIGNGYDKVPYMYHRLQKMNGNKNTKITKITQSSIEYV